MPDKNATKDIEDIEDEEIERFPFWGSLSKYRKKDIEKESSKSEDESGD